MCLDEIASNAAPARGNRSDLGNFAGQGVADDACGQSGTVDQGVQIDTGRDARGLAQLHQLLGRNIAGGSGVAGKRATAQTTDR